MGGFAGYWKQGRDAEDAMRHKVTRMTDAILHRGPDGSGDWIDAEAGVALGFRRLSALDHSGEDSRSMVSANGRFVIASSGKVHNATALCKELESLGRRFREGSDAGVILEAIDEWGLDKALGRFGGMFAFALWDRREKRLSLARDRFGEMPIYYGWSGSTFLFGSELKALRAHPDFHAEIDRQALTLFLRCNVVPTPFSIYKGIQKLAPGCTVEISPEVGKVGPPRPYWSLRDAAERGMSEPFVGTEEEAIGQLDSILRDAVGSRMVPDAPMGASLSGGLDSSIVVAMMQAQSSKPVNTFTVCFEANGFNEGPQAKAFAAQMGTNHTEVCVTAADALKVMPRLPEIYDEPFADSSQIPTCILLQSAWRKVKVTLSGDGADELFAGYPEYIDVAEGAWRKIRWLPPAIRRCIAKGMRVPGGRHRAGKFLQRLSHLFLADTPEALYHRVASHWKTPEEVVIDGFEPPTVRTNPSQWLRRGDFSERMFFIDALSYLPDDVLTKVDRASMAASIQSRAPFLDHRVAEFSWRLPRSFKVRDGQGKWILRELLNRYVPRKSAGRARAGFNVPIRDWLRGPLRPWAEALLDESRLRREGYFRPEPIREKWTEHLAGEYNWEYYLWDILMFQTWLERWK